ncbi:MAG: ComF family protein [Parvularculaceae bacterium]
MSGVGLHFRQRIAAGWRVWLDALIPPYCPATGAPVSAPGDMSPNGWAGLHFIDEPLCAVCGVPFGHDYGADAVCAACIAAPPAFERARAAVVYDDASHGLVVRFKHSDGTELAPMFARWMARAGAPLLEAGAVLAPVPLHRRRLIVRRYNQAALLSRALSALTGAPVLMTALARKRATPPQKNLSADARRRNVAGAFEVRAEAVPDVAGARIVLVDDVLTTGATLSAAARALLKAGAASVDALALARVVKGGLDAI